ncbi:uncharacterized protein N0V89_007288 [Didymosphaeria variabile]|uniref:Mid2 domain-containing protein n=1 Tax=Didymosphaeria variabile TaxID=1932322 RepID=A0A9W8XIL3_9PLEO|nr:uncharacterized protein N0V89_007288 [Didymosphaeria variabile]KAJ4351943.1 hypothetical protein N0V89_007288 [Didymosphaeria variabile]
MIFQLPITLLSSIVCVALANVIPADPTITPPAILPRQADAAWIGWVKDNGTWTTQQCDAGNTWYQSGDYAQCCAETLTACPAPTACVRGNQIYPLSGTTITTACTENYNNATYSVCNTAFIFESFGDSSPKTDIVCGDKSQVWSYYRNVPASVTESPSAGSGSSDSDKGGSSGSKAWIAGAVVGPIVGIALIAIIVFLLMRRSKKNKQSNVPQTGGAALGPSGVQQHYTETKPQLTNPSYGQAPPGVNDTYNQQAYSQQGYAQQPTSPTPQYQQPYGAPTSPPPQQQPYGAPTSPTQPQQGAYAAQDAKFGYTAQPQHPNTAELGGVSSPVGGQHTAELPSGTRGT